METSTIHQADGGGEEEWAEPQQWAEPQHQDELQAGMKRGFFFPKSNKCLPTVKPRGAGTEYIPQSSSIQQLFAIKGKTGRRGDSGARLRVVINVIMRNIMSDVLAQRQFQ
ncbi:hypothetical protein EYF80_039911 [Liparis tanakae]|uniref:Uncharacterized protein n=1 Tax=Liparis tanakae TaxID=230148 RepID=A0A4Z2G8L2_9TELE|nr:hypothetical protein EYF80_039911 [Liparis tanakae]